LWRAAVLAVAVRVVKALEVVAVRVVYYKGQLH
jgi:hypothetical protein